MIMDLVDYFNANSSIKFFPDAFPLSDTSTELGVVRMLPNYGGTKGGLVTIQIQLIIRSNHPSTSEQIAKELIKDNEKKTGFNIGSTRVVLMDIRNPFPVYMGKDENDRFKYSVESFLIIEI